MDIPDDAVLIKEVVTVTYHAECDACGWKEQQPDEPTAVLEAKKHGRECRKMHKGKKVDGNS